MKPTMSHFQEAQVDPEANRAAEVLKGSPFLGSWQDARDFLQRRGPQILWEAAVLFFGGGMPFEVRKGFQRKPPGDGPVPICGQTQSSFDKKVSRLSERYQRPQRII